MDTPVNRSNASDHDGQTVICGDSMLYSSSHKKTQINKTGSHTPSHHINIPTPHSQLSAGHDGIIEPSALGSVDIAHGSDHDNNTHKKGTKNTDSCAAFGNWFIWAVSLGFYKPKTQQERYDDESLGALASPNLAQAEKQRRLEQEKQEQIELQAAEEAEKETMFHTNTTSTNNKGTTTHNNQDSKNDDDHHYEDKTIDLGQECSGGYTDGTHTLPGHNNETNTSNLKASGTPMAVYGQHNEDNNVSYLSSSHTSHLDALKPPGSINDVPSISALP